MTDAVKPKQITFAEMLAMLATPRSTAYHLMATDPSFPKGAKIGRRRMFRVEDLDRYLATKHATGQEG